MIIFKNSFYMFSYFVVTVKKDPIARKLRLRKRRDMVDESSKVLKVSKLCYISQ